MPIKNLTLGLCLLLSGSALAQHQNYRIKEGDTLSGIAERFHVRTVSLRKANGLKSDSNLKIGRVLTIPSATVSSDLHKSKTVPSKFGGYTVHKGDNDVLIAKRLGLTSHQLRTLNPGVNWQALQLGQVLRVASSKREAVTAKVSSHSSSIAHSQASSPAKASGYAVREGENDWIIAHRLGITTVVLKRLNPGVNLARLHVGQRIKVPASSMVARKSSPPRVNSRYAVVNGDSVSIRRHPSTGAEVVTQVNAGVHVVVLDRDGDWYRLRFPKGTEGWVRGDLLRASAPVAAPRVALRKHAPAPAAKHGTRIAKASPSKSRRRVATRHEELQASHGEFTQQLMSYQKSSKGDPDKILEKAQSFRGVRYRWGAMSRSATDCSGFTSQVFKSQGYRLPRTSREQATTGIPVHAKDLKKGDLVFFHTMRGARVTHVGIYIGNGKFIHASSGGGKVQVNSLSDGYYKKRLVGARRVAKPVKGKVVANSSPTSEDPAISAPSSGADSSTSDKE